VLKNNDGGFMQQKRMLVGMNASRKCPHVDCKRLHQIKDLVFIGRIVYCPHCGKKVGCS
jgi:hypothetical protein